jgi:hypothetical protein
MTYSSHPDVFQSYFSSNKNLLEINMNKGKKPATATANGTDLHFIDGTESHSTYAVIARRGSVFLGIRFSGITRGEQLGAPGKAYLQIRVRSARDQALADKLDAEAGDNNVVNLLDKQLPLDTAWPGLTFEKVDSNRASVVVGMFIAGSVPAEGGKVVARIKEADLFRKLVDYVVGAAGPEHCMAPAEAVAGSLSDQAKPLVEQLQQVATQHEAATNAQKEFAAQITDQLEVAGPHLQYLNAFYHKHQQPHDPVEPCLSVAHDMSGLGSTRSVR